MSWVGIEDKYFRLRGLHRLKLHPIDFKVHHVDGHQRRAKVNYDHESEAMK